LRTLGEIAKEEMSDGNRREFTIQIRRDGGPPVLSASITLMCKRTSEVQTDALRKRSP
jgi:hypothetical protein